MKDEILTIESLSDVQTVGLLIAYRDLYDPYTQEVLGVNKMAAQGALPLREKIIELYSMLDELIERCQFDETQKTIIQLSGLGHSTYEIGRAVGIPHNVVQARFHTICRKIVKENLRQWRKYAYSEKLGLKTKRCNRCLEELPATTEFYNQSEWSKDGFLSICRKCR